MTVLDDLIAARAVIESGSQRSIRKACGAVAGISNAAIMDVRLESANANFNSAYWLLPRGKKKMLEVMDYAIAAERARLSAPGGDASPQHEPGSRT